MARSRVAQYLLGDPTDPLHSAPKQYVDAQVASRALLVPGATAMPVASGVATPNGANGAPYHRVSTATNLTIAPAASVADTQALTYEISTTAAITLTLDPSYEIGGNARTRAFPIRSGVTAFVYVIVRQGTSGLVQRLTGIDDGG